MVKIVGTIIETELNEKRKWTITNHKSIPKLIEWIKGTEKIIIRQDKESVWAINPKDLTIIIWRIKGTPIVRKR